MTELIGWASSFVLLLTIGKQIHKQWRDDSSEGVSKWLFVGQLTASGGFSVYSYLVRNWVFVVTNLLMVLAALIGLAIVLHHRAKRARRPLAGPGAAAAAAAAAPIAEVAGPTRH